VKFNKETIFVLTIKNGHAKNPPLYKRFEILIYFISASTGRNHGRKPQEHRLSGLAVGCTCL
jgi:hypothetical protein